MTRRETILILLSGVVSAAFFEHINAEDVSGGGREVYPLNGLTARRGLDYCQTNSNPCKNGGSCCSDAQCTSAGHSYTCKCTTPYSGPHCEDKCPIKGCWDDFYTTAYSNGRKRGVSEEACKSNVEALGSCLKSAVASEESCHCDFHDVEGAKHFEKESKMLITARQCGGAHTCEDPEVKECVRKVYSVGGAMDGGKTRTEKEKCALVDEAVSCMQSFAGSDFAGCPADRKMFTEKVGMRQAEWRTWCMGEFCSLHGCGEIKVPEKCSEAAMVSSIKPVLGCIREKLERCVPAMKKKLELELREIEKGLRDAILNKCKLKKELSGKCDNHKRILQARDLLRALLAESLAD